MRKHITITARDSNGDGAILHFKTLDEWVPLYVGGPSRNFLPSKLTKVEICTTEGDDDTVVHMYRHPIIYDGEYG